MPQANDIASFRQEVAFINESKLCRGTKAEDPPKLYIARWWHKISFLRPKGIINNEDELKIARLTLINKIYKEHAHFSTADMDPTQEMEELDKLHDLLEPIYDSVNTILNNKSSISDMPAAELEHLRSFKNISTHIKTRKSVLECFKQLKETPQIELKARNYKIAIQNQLALKNTIFEYKTEYDRSVVDLTKIFELVIEKAKTLIQKEKEKIESAESLFNEKPTIENLRTLQEVCDDAKVKLANSYKELKKFKISGENIPDSFKNIDAETESALKEIEKVNDSKNIFEAISFLKNKINKDLEDSKNIFLNEPTQTTWDAYLLTEESAFEKLTQLENLAKKMGEDSPLHSTQFNQSIHLQLEIGNLRMDASKDVLINNFRRSFNIEISRLKEDLSLYNSSLNDFQTLNHLRVRIFDLEKQAKILSILRVKIPQSEINELKNLYSIQLRYPLYLDKNENLKSFVDQYPELATDLLKALPEQMAQFYTSAPSQKNVKSGVGTLISLTQKKLKEESTEIIQSRELVQKFQKRYEKLNALLETRKTR